MHKLAWFLLMIDIMEKAKAKTKQDIEKNEEKRKPNKPLNLELEYFTKKAGFYFEECYN